MVSYVNLRVLKSQDYFVIKLKNNFVIKLKNKLKCEFFSLFLYKYWYIINYLAW